MEQRWGECDQVAPYVFVASEEVASSYEKLQACNIKYVINLAGLTFDNMFSGQLEYLTYYIGGKCLLVEVICVLVEGFRAVMY